MIIFFQTEYSCIFMHQKLLLYNLQQRIMTYRVKVIKKETNQDCYISHVLFYRKVYRSLLIRICILAMHRRFIGCLPLLKIN